jgi:hypothetical protein
MRPVRGGKLAAKATKLAQSNPTNTVKIQTLPLTGAEEKQLAFI